MQRNKPLTGPLKDIGQHYVKLNDTVYLHHRSESLPPEVFESPRRARQPEPQQALESWSPGDYASSFITLRASLGFLWSELFFTRIDSAARMEEIKLEGSPAQLLACRR